MIVQAPTQQFPENSEYLLQLIPETDAARFVGYTIRALQNWRVRGGGPKYVKVSSRSVRYRRKDLIDWAESRVIASSNQATVR